MYPYIPHFFVRCAQFSSRILKEKTKSYNKTSSKSECLSTVLFRVGLNHLADVNKVGAFESQPDEKCTFCVCARAHAGEKHFDWLNVK